MGYFKDGSTCDLSQATVTTKSGAPFFKGAPSETPRANFPLRQLQAPAMANRGQTNAANAPVADPMAARAAPPVSRKSAKGWAELQEGEASPVPRDQVPRDISERAIKQAAAQRKKQQQQNAQEAESSKRPKNGKRAIVEDDDSDSDSEYVPGSPDAAGSAKTREKKRPEKFTGECSAGRIRDGPIKHGAKAKGKKPDTKANGNSPKKKKGKGTPKADAVNYRSTHDLFVVLPQAEVSACVDLSYYTGQAVFFAVVFAITVIFTG